MYRPLPEYLTIKSSSIHGLGLFATQDIEANHNLGITHVYDERFKDNYIRLPLGGFFNHSEDPNCIIVEKFTMDNGETLHHLQLHTLKNINSGEELTARYTIYNPIIN